MTQHLSHLRVSAALIQALKAHREPAYRVAWKAGLHPTSLSKILSGAMRVSATDSRVLAVGALLGLAPEQCFEPEGNQPEGRRSHEFAASA